MFLEDEDYIERGNLIFERYDEKITYNYFHSWICFKYKDEEYVFDPYLNL